ncbi:polysaccharide biosynthesis protein, partial [Acinetobacter baumannii]|uniref:polysaccharide biosynthesis protein n=2 Tax=Bacteria TaxID=2 RepID=UPI003319DA89
ENGAYSVKCEVGDKVTVEIASVRDYEKMDCIMNKYRPDIVFHAAAHKHVPFMELSPEEAVKNNVKGTETVADLAEKYNADNFVLIST